MTEIVALCINLAGAQERWKHIGSQAARWLKPLGVPLVRVEAVHWQTVAQNLPDVPLTPFTRWILEGSTERQRAHRASHRQMDTLSSVACMLSHIQCWQWLRAHPTYGAALVLEDDACFDGKRFHAAWQEIVRPTLAAATERDVDVLLLGYFNEIGVQPSPALESLYTAENFFGAHAYCVTQRGAERLLRDVLPLELQSDGYLCTLADLGRVRLYLLPASVVSQCQDTLQREGAWHTHVVMSTNTHHHHHHHGGGEMVAARQSQSRRVEGICTWMSLVVLVVAIGVLVMCGYTVGRRAV